MKREQIRGGGIVKGGWATQSGQQSMSTGHGEEGTNRGGGLSSPGLGSEENILRIMISNPQSLFSSTLELWNNVNVDNQAYSMGAVSQSTSQQCSRHRRDTGLAWKIGARRGDR